MLYLIILAVLIILALAGTAIYYVTKLKRVQKQQEEQVKKNKAAWEAHRNELASDIKFIAHSMIQEQCEITEGCMRIAVLMDRLDDELQHKPEFKTIREHFSLTISMPTHQAYKDLSRKEQFKLDKQRYALEEKNKDQVLEEAKTLLHYNFEILNPN